MFEKHDHEFGYRLPNGVFLMFQKQLRGIFSKTRVKTGKMVISKDDFHINLLNFVTKKNVRGFFQFHV